jgi:hypothetical protein
MLPLLLKERLGEVNVTFPFYPNDGLSQWRKIKKAAAANFRDCPDSSFNYARTEAIPNELFPKMTDIEVVPACGRVRNIRNAHHTR